MKENDWLLVILTIAIVAVESVVIIITSESVMGRLKEIFASLWPFGYRL